MPSRLGGRAVAGRVTGIAVTNTTGIVSPGSAGESCRGMAGRTIQASQNMGWQGIHHACRRIAIVTGRTIVDDASMIEGCRHEAARVMAYTTILIGRDMTGFLGCRETGAMTGRAVIHDARVAKARRFKTGGLMAVDAITVGRHMEVVFADSGITVMTGDTVVDDALVFKPGVGKRCWSMAYRAILGGWNVGRIDFRVLANGVDTIVAGCAVIHDTGMIEHRRLEAAACYVAETAILGCCNVARVHTFCGTSPIGYMTGIAAHG